MAQGLVSAEPVKCPRGGGPVHCGAEEQLAEGHQDRVGGWEEAQLGRVRPGEDSRGGRRRQRWGESASRFRMLVFWGHVSVLSKLSGFKMFDRRWFTLMSHSPFTCLRAHMTIFPIGLVPALAAVAGKVLDQVRGVVAP